MIEKLAKEIYAAMRFEREDSTPEWVEGGNSTAQGEARAAARKIADRFMSDVTVLRELVLSGYAGNEVLHSYRELLSERDNDASGWIAEELANTRRESVDE